MAAPFNTTAAIAMQSSAADRLKAAIANGTAVRILWDGCPYMTAESMEAAKRLIGKSKRMTAAPY